MDSLTAWDERAGDPPVHAPDNCMVVCVLCIDGDAEVVHIFSTPALAKDFMTGDDRTHVVYDYLIDNPTRMENRLQ